MKKKMFALLTIGFMAFAFLPTKVEAGTFTTCVKVTIICEGGTGSNTVVCGTTMDELIDELMDAVDVICG